MTIQNVCYAMRRLRSDEKSKMNGIHFLLARAHVLPDNQGLDSRVKILARNGHMVTPWHLRDVYECI